MLSSSDIPPAAPESFICVSGSKRCAPPSEEADKEEKSGKSPGKYPAAIGKEAPMSKDVDEIKALYDAPQKKEVFAECKRMTKAELAAHVVASNTKIQELEAELASLKSVEPEDTAKDLSKILDVGGTEERMRLSSTDESKVRRLLDVLEQISKSPFPGQSTGVVVGTGSRRGAYLRVHLANDKGSGCSSTTRRRNANALSAVAFLTGVAEEPALGLANFLRYNGEVAGVAASEAGLRK